jgi:hypothetical protein
MHHRGESLEQVRQVMAQKPVLALGQLWALVQLPVSLVV